MSTKPENDYDVAISGAGGIGAANAGARVPLIEMYGLLGGAATRSKYWRRQDLFG